jgi:hypothetical protein
MTKLSIFAHIICSITGNNIHPIVICILDLLVISNLYLLLCFLIDLIIGNRTKSQVVGLTNVYLQIKKTLLLIKKSTRGRKNSQFNEQKIKKYYFITIIAGFAFAFSC